MTSSNKNTKTLIVGGDSLVGKSYREYLERAGRRVMSTTRRPRSANYSTLYLDLADDTISWVCPENVDVAILCAGITKFAVCKDDPKSTSQVNVAGMSGLARNLIENSVRVIYLSTAVVFDGLLPHRCSQDSLCPNTEYGRQNAEAETKIKDLDPSVTVLRLTKTLGPDTPLLHQWVNALQNDQPVHPYTNLVMAPISVDFAVNVIDRLAMNAVPGIFQASANRDVTYEEAAYICAEVLGADTRLIQGINVNEENRYTERIPQNTSLDASRLKSEFGIETPDAEQALRDLFSSIATSSKFGDRRTNVSIK